MVKTPQALTVPVSVRSIVSSPAFARGLSEARAGLPFNSDDPDDTWGYERGRAFARIAPRTMPLRIGGRLNPEALKLAQAAFMRKALL
jgi:hypothetical protein